MARIIVLISLLLLPACLWAQFSDFGVPKVYPKEMPVRISSAMAASVLMNFDLLDTANLFDTLPVLPCSTTHVIWSDDNQNYDHRTEMSLMTENFYTSTWSTSLSVPGVTDLYFYYQAATESTFTSQVPLYGGGSTWPEAAFWANLHNDPVGDYVHPDGQNYSNCDLTNFKMARAGNKLYFKITTAGGVETLHTRSLGCSWPIASRALKYFHIYGIPLINPNSDFADSVFYVLLYSNINDGSINTLLNLLCGSGHDLNIQAGLWKFWKMPDGTAICDYLSARQRIDDAVSGFAFTASGNEIQMQCNISALTADPIWGSLPADPCILSGAGMVTLWAGYKPGNNCNVLSVTDTFYFNVTDATNNILFYLSQGHINLNDGCPTLTGATGTHIGGGMVDFQVTYTDVDNNCPTVRTVTVDGTPYTLGTPDHIYGDGATYRDTLGPFSFGTHNYTFDFSDGACPATASGSFEYAPALNVWLNGVDGNATWSPEVDSLSRGGTVTMKTDERLTVTNMSDVAADFGLNLLFDSTYVHYAAVDTVGINIFRLYGRFDDQVTPPIPAAFTANDKIRNWTTETWASATVFGPIGYNVPVSGTNSLWLQFVAPTYYSPAMPTLTLRVFTRAYIP